MEFEYDAERAASADKAADRITEQGAYIMSFPIVEGFTTDGGAKGMRFHCDAKGVGTAQFTLYTHSKEGKETFGVAQVDAMMCLLGLKRLKSVTGPVKKWEGNELVDSEGDRYPDLEGKDIGVVLQTEKYPKQNGTTGERFNLYGLFQAETKLMASEIKERKTTPVKLDRLLKGLKVKDTRKPQADEAAQPSMGGALAEGGY